MHLHSIFFSVHIYSINVHRSSLKLLECKQIKCPSPPAPLTCSPILTNHSCTVLYLEFMDRKKLFILLMSASRWVVETRCSLLKETHTHKKKCDPTWTTAWFYQSQATYYLILIWFCKKKKRKNPSQAHRLANWFAQTVLEMCEPPGSSLLNSEHSALNKSHRFFWDSGRAEAVAGDQPGSVSLRGKTGHKLSVFNLAFSSFSNPKVKWFLNLPSRCGPV